MDPTCGLADKIRDLVWDLIWKHILYLVHYNRNIEQLDGQLDDLICERRALQHRIDEATNNGKQIEENVLRWLGEVDKISEQVQQLHRESEAKLECGITSCPNPWLRCKLSKRAETIAQVAVEIAIRNFDRVGYDDPLPLLPELTNNEGNEGIDSRFPIVYQIIEELGEPGVNMIGLCGLGGIGKTTIAKEVAKNQKIFEKVIMATVSQELNIEKIQSQIAEKLSMQLTGNDLGVRAFHLCKRLKQEKNMLLILDDLWEELDLGKIGIPLVLLPKLEILELSNLNSLISLIWDDQLLHNSFNNLKTLTVKNCGFVKLVPLHVLKSLNNLEEAIVISCDMLEIVFDFEDLNDYYKEMDSSLVVVPLKKLELWNLPKLKNVWSEHYQGNVSFLSLRSVAVFHCQSLTSIFPASIAKGMLCDLEELRIHQCGVDVIVAKDQVSESVAVTFGFPRLTSLVLYGLPNLKNFYPQKHTLEWPHLNQLCIQCCDELEIFEKEVSGSSEIYEEENMLHSKYPLLPHDKVIGNLERLTLQGKEVEKIGSGQFLMYHFPKLKWLHLSLEKKPFNRFWGRSPNLGELKLSGDFEKALGGDNVVALTARFSKLTLEKISIMGSLSPSLVSSPNLTHLNVNSCMELTTLMTSSIARSLVHLTHLSISACNQIEEIITKQEGEDDEDKEIFFRKLVFLLLDNLPRLKRFCGYNYTFKFLLLHQLIIIGCPKFKIFSHGLIETPSLKSVQLETKDWEKDHEIWDNDLNKILSRQRFLTSREVVLDEDDAIMIRNDQLPVDCCPQVEILQIEGFVEQWVTFPYTLLERFPNLKELHVKNSSFEEIFPSHIPSFTSFHNLTELNVSKCHQLVYLVTTSTTKSLVNLETMEIDDCAKLEEIVIGNLERLVWQGKGVEKIGSGQFLMCNFPKLKLLHLSLEKTPFPDIKFWGGSPNLRELKLSGDFGKALEGDNVAALAACFTKLTLENISIMGSLSPSLVSSPNLTYLNVQWCDGTTLMTSSIARSLVHLTHLSISRCVEIEEIITKQEGEDDEDREILFRKLEFLKLYHLRVLKRFCGFNYTFKFLLLDQLIIIECPKFKTFSPGVIETPCLKSVQLSKDWEKYHEIWDNDLNKTLSRQRYMTPREVVLDEDDAIMIRNDQFPVDCCPQVEILQIEGFVEEWVTFPYTLLERFPKLNELHVKNSSFEEIFPSHTPSFTSFHNLKVLKVSKCHQLVYLVTTSTTKSLVNLKTLEIHDCAKLEEVVRNDTDEDVEGGITFNVLRILKLTHLPRLKTQEDQRDFNIEDRATNTRCTNIPRSLFSHNKVY
ncbi:hypothetical protein K1719_041187 [Acacia pycnantha]|nr:hypothetical protein K1719_041187 [Acacia pycnantha]